MPIKNVRGKNISFSETGQGIPLVLVHGFPLDSRIWANQVSGLSDSARVITLDLPGFGQSQNTGPFTMDSLAEDIHGLLTAIGALPCVLAGLSMGGYVAYAFASKFGADLMGLMPVDTKAAADTAEGKAGRNAMIELVRTKGTSAVADQMQPKMTAPSASGQIVQQLRAIMDACPAKTIEYACAAMRDRADYVPLLPKIKCPTLVIVGQEDAIASPAIAEEMKAKIPGAQLAAIPGAGHMSPLEKPKEFNEAVRKFLKTLKV